MLSFFEMTDNYNIMIATNSSPIRKIEEENVESIAKWKREFDIPFDSIKCIEKRLEDIEDRTKANARDSAGLSRTVGAFVDTVNILESRLRSVYSRVSVLSALLFDRANEDETQLVEIRSRICIYR